MGRYWSTAKGTYILLPNGCIAQHLLLIGQDGKLMPFEEVLYVEIMKGRYVNCDLIVNSSERLNFVKTELNYGIAEMTVFEERIRNDSLPTWE